jgi:membrane protein implicated in regulation of membrane protease activity
MRLLPGASEMVEGSSAALTGIGALTFAFFPLAIPIVLLTAVALIPLAAVALAGGLVAAVVAAPLLLARWMRGRLRRRALRERPERERRTSSPIGASRLLHESH